MKHSLYILLFILPLWQISFAQTVDVRVENIVDKPGIIRFALFANQWEFVREKPSWEAAYSKCLVSNGILHVRIEITPGTYGLSVLDDANGNGRMEYSLFGFPKEGFGFSNFVQKGIRKPCFSDFCFTIKKDEILPITVYMKYF